MKLPRFIHHNRPDPTYIAGLIMLGLSTVLLMAAIYIQHQPRHAVTQTPYAIGQTIAKGSVSLKIHNVTYSDGKKSFPIPPSQHYVIVDLSVTNTSEQPVNILPASDIYLKTTSGEVSYLTPFELDRPFHAGELSPGETVTGQISYAAAKTAQSKLYVDGIWSGGVLPFSLR